VYRQGLEDLWVSPLPSFLRETRGFDLGLKLRKSKILSEIISPELLGKIEDGFAVSIRL